MNLSTADVAIARSVARKVRESSGGLPAVKAIGVPLASRGLAQVSLNLTDFESTGIGQAFEAVKANAAEFGVEIAGSQIIGLVPRRAMVEAAATLHLAARAMVRSACWKIAWSNAPRIAPSTLCWSTLNPWLLMGGGSAAALAGAISAALGTMVARIGKLDDGPPIGTLCRSRRARRRGV